MTAEPTSTDVREEILDTLDEVDAALQTGHSTAGIRSKLKKRGVCSISGLEVPKKDLFPIDMLRPALAEQLRLQYPDLDPDAKISLKELNKVRGQYVEALLRDERGELSTLEQDVVASLERHETLAEDIEREWEGHRTIGELMADVVASFGGSWTFIIVFFVILSVWMGINLALGEASFDAYPFILLNLVLSCLAAIQAPIIMMSQKRQEAKDRLRSENDFRVNLKAELEIRHLHEKVDHLLNKQWERLTEIQEIQLELLQDLAARKPVIKAKVRSKARPKAKSKKSAAPVLNPAV
ncbi:MAG: DUF1003 domain-containing protein [Beijerinckiaceae bacterium]|nr:DUF1003 domain-containing protein [Beijerinckiaceae bacterium]